MFQYRVKKNLIIILLSIVATQNTKAYHSDVTENALIIGATTGFVVGGITSFLLYTKNNDMTAPVGIAAGLISGLTSYVIAKSIIEKANKKESRNNFLSTLNQKEETIKTINEKLAKNFTDAYNQIKLQPDSYAQLKKIEEKLRTIQGTLTKESETIDRLFDDAPGKDNKVNESIKNRYTKLAELIPGLLNRLDYSIMIASCEEATSIINKVASSLPANSANIDHKNLPNNNEANQSLWPLVTITNDLQNYKDKLAKGSQFFNLATKNAQILLSIQPLAPDDNAVISDVINRCNSGDIIIKKLQQKLDAYIITFTNDQQFIGQLMLYNKEKETQMRQKADDLERQMLKMQRAQDAQFASLQDELNCMSWKQALTARYYPLAHNSIILI